MTVATSVKQSIDFYEEDYVLCNKQIDYDDGIDVSEVNAYLFSLYLHKTINKSKHLLSQFSDG
jgi:hypothetical protein